MPIGLHETDLFFHLLENLGGCSTPVKFSLERGRLLDAYIDGQKYVLSKRVVIYGEEDLVVGLTSFLAEIGAQPVLCGSRGHRGSLQEAITRVTKNLLTNPPIVREGVNFQEIAAEVESMTPDLIISHSRIQRFARHWGIPLIRVGFPIHDRFDGQRILHLGYRGAHELYDRIVNALVAQGQEDSFVDDEYI
jgi:nitrogenase molybdenum-iron protein NifN